MKIGLSTRSFQPPLIGGVDVYTDRLGRELERRGQEVFYLAFNSSEEFGQEIRVRRDTYEGRPIWRFLFDFNKRPPEASQSGYDPEMGMQIRSILKQEKPDLLIILNFYMSTLAAVEAAKELSIPVIHIATDYLPVCRRATMIRWNGQSCTVGESIRTCTECYVSSRSMGRMAASIVGGLPEKMLVNMAKKKYTGIFFSPMRVLKPYWKQIQLMDRRLELLAPLRQKIDLVLAPNRNTARIFCENGFDADQVKFLPFGVESDSLLESVEHLPTDHIRFLFIGRLQPYKGLHLLVKAFNQLASPKNATLTIYGVRDGYDAYSNELNAMMAANKNIHFKGKIPPTELGQAFSEADYFVLPSTWHENSPLILLDALQSGTPAIASEIGGVTDILKHGVNGLLFPMGDVRALQAILQRLIDKPELVTQFKARSVLPTIEKYVDTMLSLCREHNLIPNSKILVET